MPDVNEELLDIDGLCRLLGGSRPLSQATIYRSVKAGHLPRSIQVTPGARRWRRSEVMEALAAKAAERDAAA